MTFYPFVATGGGGGGGLGPVTLTGTPGNGSIIQATSSTSAVWRSQLFIPPVALVDAATIAVNAALGNQFTVTLGGNRTLGAPSNPSAGQIITFWLTQDGTGSRTITLPSSAGGYIFGTDLTSVTLSTTPGATDRLTCQYNGTNWDVTGFLRGWAS